MEDSVCGPYETLKGHLGAHTVMSYLKSLKYMFKNLGKDMPSDIYSDVIFDVEAD